MSNAIPDKQWVGIDLHLHRSVIVRIDEHGKELEWVRIDNDPKALVREVRKAGRGAPVAIEATYGWGQSTRCGRRSSTCTSRTRTG